eukprot:Skav214435  [mRNA]  locus=scaffold586:438313:451290:+ [translate_table: standard]
MGRRQGPLSGLVLLVGVWAASGAVGFFDFFGKPPEEEVVEKGKASYSQLKILNALRKWSKAEGRWKEYCAQVGGSDSTMPAEQVKSEKQLEAERIKLANQVRDFIAGPENAKEDHALDPDDDESRAVRAEMATRSELGRRKTALESFLDAAPGRHRGRRPWPWPWDAMGCHGTCADGRICFSAEAQEKPHRSVEAFPSDSSKETGKAAPGGDKWGV